MTAGQCSSYRLLINRFLKSSFGPALLPSIDSRFPKRMPLTIYSLSVPRTLGGGDCVLIYKLLARRKGFSRSQVPILGIEDSRPVIKSRMLAGLRWFFCHTRHVPLRGYSVVRFWRWAKKLRYMSKIAAIFAGADNTRLSCTQPIANLPMAGL